MREHRMTLVEPLERVGIHLQLLPQSNSVHPDNVISAPNSYLLEHASCIHASMSHTHIGALRHSFIRYEAAPHFLFLVGYPPQPLSANRPLSRQSRRHFYSFGLLPGLGPGAWVIKRITVDRGTSTTFSTVH